jgi:hypothetical protein
VIVVLSVLNAFGIHHYDVPWLAAGTIAFVGMVAGIVLVDRLRGLTRSSPVRGRPNSRTTYLALPDKLIAREYVNERELSQKIIADRSVRFFDIPTDHPNLVDVTNVVFNRCTILGPAIILFDGCSFKDNRFLTMGAGTESIFWPKDGGATGVFRAKWCVFADCCFVGIGVAGTPDAINQIRQDFKSGIDDASPPMREA